MLSGRRRWASEVKENHRGYIHDVPYDAVLESIIRGTLPSTVIYSNPHGTSDY
jgi:hypothetical protein